MRHRQRTAALAVRPVARRLAVAALAVAAGAALASPVRGAPQADGARRGLPESFAPHKATWARFSERERGGERTEPGEAELAARFGLERIGPRELDGIVEYRHPKNGMRFVFVPGGAFRMGSNHSDIFTNPMVIDAAMRGRIQEDYFAQEQPQKEIWVSSFFIGVHEVTNAEYRAFVEAAAAGKVGAEHEWPILLGPAPKHVPYLTGDPRRAPFDGERQPVTGVTWIDAYAFCSWMGGRLPTEAEWEKAARGSDGRTFPWGNHFDPMRLNCAESQNRVPLDVGIYPGGRSPYGCFDMAGNVAEYCLDAFEESLPRHIPAVNPCLLERWPARDRRSLRGGSWNRFGLLYKARTGARGFTLMAPRFPDPTRESLDAFPITEYLFAGIRVCLPAHVDPFPEGAKERLLAQAIEIGKQRVEALQRRRAAEGKPPLPVLPGLPGLAPLDGEDDSSGAADPTGGGP